MTTTTLATRIAPIAALAADEARWRDLADEALEPNPFFRPGFLIASDRHLAGGAGQAVVAEDARGRFVGLLPFLPAPLGGGGLAPAWRGFLTPYASLDTPLIRLEDPSGTALALLEGLAGAGGLRRLLLLNAIDGDGPVARALAEAARRSERGIERTATIQRAALRRPARVEAERLASLGRKLRRLPRGHEVAIGLVTDRPARLEAFLALEASGWKGRASTALASRPASAAFAREALLAADCDVRFDELTFAGAPIAMNLNLRDRGALFSIKSAYDEAHAKRSPGVVLDGALTEAILADPDLDLADSCALPGHPLDGLWLDRRSIARIAIDVARRPSSLGFRGRLAVAGFDIAARAAAKRLYGEAKARIGAA